MIKEQKGELKGEEIAEMKWKVTQVGIEGMLGFKAIVRTLAFTLGEMGAMIGFWTEERHDLINVQNEQSDFSVKQ